MKIHLSITLILGIMEGEYLLSRPENTLLVGIWGDPYWWSNAKYKVNTGRVESKTSVEAVAASEHPWYGGALWVLVSVQETLLAGDVARSAGAPAGLLIGGIG